MTEELDPAAATTGDDDLLVQVDLAQSTFDPVPAGLVDDINVQLTVAMLEADVAVALDEAALAGVRTSTLAPQLFECDGTEIAVMCEPHDTDLVHITGWVTWPGARLQLVINHVAYDLQADHHGKFVGQAQHRGVGYLIVWPPADHRPQRQPVVTPFFEV